MKPIGTRKHVTRDMRHSGFGWTNGKPIGTIGRMSAGDAGPTVGNPPALESSPRRRILSSAVALFYRQGIQATGVTELCDAAHVSKRTLYQLYGGKDDLVAAYLELLHERRLVPTEQALERTDLRPRERLAALFDRPDPARFRGCPFHNASVELTDPGHPARRVIIEHKAAFLDRLTTTARAADCHDPEKLGQQLLLLFEGATALATTLGDLTAFDTARLVAERLVTDAVDSRRTG
jgi:AcrR family transcriptional regulator